MALAGRIRSWFGRKDVQVPLSVSIVGLTNVGCVRDHNEDALLIQANQGDLDVAPVLVVVADGMGGQASGEVASSIAIEAVGSTALDGTSLSSSLLKALQQANEAIQTKAKTDPALENMGTTCTAMAFSGDCLYLGHVGDTRAYLVRDLELRQLTTDHTIVAQLVASKVLTPEQAKVHPHRSVLTRALGTKPEVEIDTPARTKLKVGDKVVACSDGLHDLVDDDEILDSCLRFDPEEACKSLIELALDRGGYDNITVVVALVHKKEAPNALVDAGLGEHVE